MSTRTTTRTTRTAPPAGEMAGRTGPIEGLDIEDRVVVFTDIVASTSLIDTHGDLAWLRALTSHLEQAKAAAARFGGEFMKTTGDGALAVFRDCRSAARFARDMQQTTGRAENDEAPMAVELRIGMACGPVYRWHDDYFGRTVHLAARVCAAAEPGEVLMSSTCVDACAELRSSAGDRRTVELRGFSQREWVCAQTTVCRSGVESMRGNGDGHR